MGEDKDSQNRAAPDRGESRGESRGAEPTSTPLLSGSRHHRLWLAIAAAIGAIAAVWRCA